MTRSGFRKTMVTLQRETIDYLDSIAETFEDDMPRGDLIDLMAEYVAKHELEDAIFGKAVPTEFTRKVPGEDEGGEAEEDEGTDEETV